MKQFIFIMRRHGLPMIAAAASASVLTWMMCDIEHTQRHQSQIVESIIKPVEKKEKAHEWQGN